MASAIPCRSVPRSKRYDASVLIFIALRVALIRLASKYAHSSTTSVVCCETSESRPPITPPIATACSASQMAVTVESTVRSSPSSRVSVSLFPPRRMMIFDPRSLARSKTCIGWLTSNSM